MNDRLRGEEVVVVDAEDYARIGQVVDGVNGGVDMKLLTTDHSRARATAQANLGIRTGKGCDP
jgi:hypothetical protein